MPDVGPKTTGVLERTEWLVASSMFCAGLLILLAIGVISDQTSGEKPEIQHTHRESGERKSHHQKPSIAAQPLTGIKAIEANASNAIATSDNNPTKKEATQKHRDLEAQESMALWSMIMGIAAIVTALITGYGLLLLSRTLGETGRAADHAETMANEAGNATKAAQDAVKETRRIGEAQVRAYVGLENVSLGSSQISNEKNIFFGNNVKSIVVRFDARNTGQSPAIGLVVAAKLTISHSPSGDSWVIEGQKVEIGTVVSLEKNRILAFKSELPTQLYKKADFVSVITFNIGFRDVFGKFVSGTETYVSTILARKGTTTRVMSSFQVAGEHIDT